MKIKYIGLEPITNCWGDWTAGEIKEVLIRGDFMRHNRRLFEEIKTVTPSIVAPISVAKKRGRKRKIHREELQDKMERDSVEIYGDSIATPDGELKNGGAE